MKKITEELLPCPFCGNMPTITEPYNGCQCCRESGEICCQNDKCPMSAIVYFDNIMFTKEQAVKLWNTRHGESNGK